MQELLLLYISNFYLFNQPDNLNSFIWGEKNNISRMTGVVLYRSASAWKIKNDFLLWRFVCAIHPIMAEWFGVYSLKESAQTSFSNHNLVFNKNKFNFIVQL